jgi:hypothetical protein
VKAVRVQATGEHDFEPVRGLPADLPAGESVLWQGSPDWRLLAMDAFQWRKLAVYFGVLLVWRVVSTVADGASAVQAAMSLVWALPLSLAGLGIVAGLAWLSARTTVYTLTNRRIVMRLGIVLTISFNLPLSRVESAGVSERRDGSGDICLLLGGPQRIAYLHLWPHARPWHLKRTQPMLRALRGVRIPAQLLAGALQEGLAQPVKGAGSRPQAALPATANPTSRAPVGGRVPIAA